MRCHELSGKSFKHFATKIIFTCNAYIVLELPHFCTQCLLDFRFHYLGSTLQEFAFGFLEMFLALSHHPDTLLNQCFLIVMKLGDLFRKLFKQEVFQRAQFLAHHNFVRAKLLHFIGNSRSNEFV